MGQSDQSKGSAGRPESKTRKVDLPLSIDLVTNRMLQTLAGYGRLGTSRQEVVLFILRSWFWENESRLITGISSEETPLGIKAPQQEE
jgi:hypothetical protein